MEYKFKAEQESLSSETESPSPLASISTDEKRIVRKLDFQFVMPFLLMACILKCLDKLALGIAALMGIRADTHITTNQFGFAGAIFYIGFLAAQIPYALLSQRFSLKLFLGIVMVACGGAVAFTAFSTSFSHLVISQLMLGLFEASILSCCVMVVSRMYRRSEQPRRISFFVFGDGMAMILSGVVGFGVGHIDTTDSLRSWQWLMVILGSFTVLFGICCFVFLVDNPKSKSLHLSYEQEQIADIRTLDNAVVVSKDVNYGQIMECLRESRYYCYVFASMFVNLQNGSIQTFCGIIVTNVGFSKLNSMLLAIPAGAFVVFIAILGGWSVGRHGNIHYTMCAAFATSAIGTLLLTIPQLDKGRLVGFYLCPAFSLGIVLIFSSIANNVVGYTKKIFYLSSVSAANTLGCFIGPQIMLDSQKPLYIGAMVTYIACNVIAILLLLYTRYNMLITNKRRLQKPDEKVIDSEDLTDRENHNFIYRL